MSKEPTSLSTSAVYSAPTAVYANYAPTYWGKELHYIGNINSSDLDSLKKIHTPEGSVYYLCDLGITVVYIDGQWIEMADVNINQLKDNNQISNRINPFEPIKVKY